MKKTVATTRKGGTADQSLLARAFRWQKLLENGTYASIAEIARAEEINDSYVSRLLRLTLLAPDIVEAILDGRQGTGLQIEALTKPMPVEWERQRASLCLPRTASLLLPPARS
jgi:hypothetical protein